jgi:hypothetical protein
MSAISKANQDKINSWLFSEPSQIYVNDNYKFSLENEEVIFGNPEHFQNCQLCYGVPRYPLISKCSHVYCSTCLLEYFRTKLRTINNAWSVPCAYCREELTANDFHDLKTELDTNASSMISLFYWTAKTKCNNFNCGLEVSLQCLNNHEFFNCSRRIVACPAKNCVFTDININAMNHILYCPFMELYCTYCDSSYELGVLKHSCALFLKKKWLLRTQGFEVPPARQNYEFGQVVLPELRTKIDRDAADYQAIHNIVKTRIQFNSFRHRTRILQRQEAIVNEYATPLSNV